MPEAEQPESLNPAVGNINVLREETTRLLTIEAEKSHPMTEKLARRLGEIALRAEQIVKENDSHLTAELDKLEPAQKEALQRELQSAATLAQEIRGYLFRSMIT